MIRADSRDIPAADLRAEAALRKVRAFAEKHWVLGLVLFHATKMLFWFRDIQFGTGFPLTNVDYIQFYGRALRIHEFLIRSGRIWGYDPYDMAGYLSGPFLEVGSHFLAVIAHVLQPVVPMSVTILVLELVGLAGSPFLIVPAARLFGANRRQSWIAFGFTTFLIGSVEPFSTSMYKIGLWGWMVSSFLAVYQVGCLWWWSEAPSRQRWLVLVFISILALQVHPSSGVIMFPAAVAIYAVKWRRLRMTDHVLLYVAAALTAATNWFWMSPFLAFSYWRTTASYYDTAGLLDLVHRFGPFQGDPYLSISAIIHLVLVMMAVGTVRRLSVRHRALAIAAGVWMISLAIISYFGSHIPWIWTIQPGRNEFPFWLVIYVFAAASFDLDLWRTRRTKAVVVALALFCVAYSFDLPPGHSPSSRFAPPLQTELPNWQADLVRYIRESYKGEGRLMLECNDDVSPNIADLIPHMTDALLLGGQHPGNFLIARTTLLTGIYTVFQTERSDDPLAFNHKLRLMTDDELGRYLDLYNVERVIARHESTVELLRNMTGSLEEIGEVGTYHVFHVRKRSSWFVRGSGRPTFDYDRILIDRASKGPILLKCHWISTLRVDPPLSLSPKYLMDDPVPFILVDNSAGRDRVEIYNAGLPPLRERIVDLFKGVFR